MTPAKQKKSEALRRKAEELVSKMPDTVEAADIRQVRRMAQELAVHQVELELQNDELRETQARLQEVKDRYTQLYEHAPVGYVVLDTSGIIRQANATWYSLLGRPGEDFRGHPFTEAMVPEDAPIFLARFRAFFRNPRDKQIEVRLQRRGRAPFHALVEARPRPLDVGDKEQPDELMVVVSDISKRKEAEAEIHRNNERLSMVVDILQYRSESVQQFLDYALEKAIALTQSRIGYIYFYNDEKREFILNTWSRDVMKECTVINPQTCYALDKTGVWGEAVRQGKPIILNEYQAENPHKKGYPEGHVQLTRFLTVPVFHQGKIVAVVGVANKDAEYDETDVISLTLLMDSIWKSVETMKAEKALRENEHYLHTILRTTADGFWVIDNRKRIIDVNDTYCTMSGYSREEILCLGISDLDADERPEVTAARIERIIQNGSELFETRHRRKDGSIWDVEISTTFLSEKGGLFICFCRDLSERKKARDQQARLEKAESLGRMAGAVAHSYNNLLSIVIGNLELAMLDQPDDPAHPTLLSESMKAAVRAVDLGSLMLSYLGLTVVTRSRLDLIGICRKTLQTFTNRLPDTVIMEAHLPDSGPEICSNADQIGQALSILILNAVEALDGENGRITLQVGQASPLETAKDRIFPDDFKPQFPVYAFVEVEDTGCGIAHEELAKLCDPFYTTKFTGRGMGLPVALGIAKACDGCLTVISRPHQGSRFALYLPLARPDCPAP